MRNFPASAARAGAAAARASKPLRRSKKPKGGGPTPAVDFVTVRHLLARRPRQAARPARDMEAEVAIDFVSSLKGTTVQLAHEGGETVTVRIPAGVSDGGRLRIGGQGGKAPGAQPGDLLLTVRVTAHPFFKREGDDLHLELPITVIGL